MESTHDDPPLPHRLLLYLPTSTDFQDRIHQVVQHLLCGKLGGLTSYPAQGAYQRQNGQAEIENIRVLEAYCEGSERIRQVEVLRRMAAVLGWAMNQETVAIAVDGRMEKILPSPGNRPPGIEDLPVAKMVDLLEGMVGDPSDS